MAGITEKNNFRNSPSLRTFWDAGSAREPRFPAKDRVLPLAQPDHPPESAEAIRASLLKDSPDRSSTATNNKTHSRTSMMSGKQKLDGPRNGFYPPAGNSATGDATQFLGTGGGFVGAERVFSGPPSPTEDWLRHRVPMPLCRGAAVRAVRRAGGPLSSVGWNPSRSSASPGMEGAGCRRSVAGTVPSPTSRYLSTMLRRLKMSALALLFVAAL